MGETTLPAPATAPSGRMERAANAALSATGLLAALAQPPPAA